tara:strand:- start:378 stop:752 length:375 start_codon:yes stop_codon:yes gene_type:complete
MKISSTRQFGILFFIVFLIIGLWPLLNYQEIRLWSLIIALIFLLVSIIKPILLEPLNKLWIKFGNLLGKIVSPIVMAIIFFTIMTPIGLFMRLKGSDLLKLKFSKNKSYWIKREKNIGTMKRQF